MSRTIAQQMVRKYGTWNATTIKYGRMVMKQAVKVFQTKKLRKVYFIDGSWLVFNSQAVPKYMAK